MHPKSDLCQRQRKHSSRHLLIFRRTQLLRTQPENRAFQYASPDVATVRVHIASKIFFVVHDPEGDPVRFQELKISLIDQKLSASKISSKISTMFSVIPPTHKHTHTHTQTDVNSLPPSLWENRLHVRWSAAQRHSKPRGRLGACYSSASTINRLTIEWLTRMTPIAANIVIAVHH